METNENYRLSLKDVSLSFGGLKALELVSLEAKDNEILAIIGPNGAGKTCVLNCISGFYKPQSGHIFFDGKDITRWRPDKIAACGISRTFQNIELYTGATVLENLIAGRHIFLKQSWILGAIYFGPAHKEEMKARETVENIIDLLELQSYRKAIVGSVPYGIRKRVELGRALALEPKILMLDEPMAGMNMSEKEDMVRFIIDIFEGRKLKYPNIPLLRDGVKTIIIIEHDMGVVMDIANRIVVLDFGRKIAEGSPEEIQNNPAVIKAYLGEEVSADA